MQNIAKLICIEPAFDDPDMHRPERRRAPREIDKGRDIITLGNVLTDNIAISRMLAELAAALPPT